MRRGQVWSNLLSQHLGLTLGGLSGTWEKLENFRLKARRQVASEVLDPGNRKTKLSEIKVHHDKPQIAAGKNHYDSVEAGGNRIPVQVSSGGEYKNRSFLMQVLVLCISTKGSRPHVPLSVLLP